MNLKSLSCALAALAGISTPVLADHDDHRDHWWWRSHRDRTVVVEPVIGVTGRIDRSLIRALGL